MRTPNFPSNIVSVLCEGYSDCVCFTTRIKEEGKSAAVKSLISSVNIFYTLTKSDTKKLFLHCEQYMFFTMWTMSYGQRLQNCKMYIPLRTYIISRVIVHKKFLLYSHTSIAVIPSILISARTLTKDL